MTDKYSTRSILQRMSLVRRLFASLCYPLRHIIKLKRASDTRALICCEDSMQHFDAATEIQRLREGKHSRKAENVAYFQRHPEITDLLYDLITSVLVHKPENIPEFALDFFTKCDTHEDDGRGTFAGDSCPRPLVIAGPSGVGKGTIINMLLKAYPDQFGFSVSHTTRDPRPGEVDGVHYYFTTREKMAQDIAENKFIEHAQVHNNVYGTSLEAVSHVQSQGKICILDIDIQGVSRVKMAEFYPAPYFVFISPPSITHLEDRLRARNTETEETIRVRLENAAEEMQYGTQLHFDKVLVNDGLERAFADLLRTLTEWYPYLLTN